MTGLSWEADLLGEAELLAGIDRMEQAFSDFRYPLEMSAKRAAQSIGENIVQNIDGFAPLAASTLYETASYRLGGPLYRGKGGNAELMEAASDTTGGNPGSGYKVGKEEATAGLNPDSRIGKIGGYLARGHSASGKVPALPARSFVRVLDSDVDYMTDQFAQFVDKTVEAAFRTRGGSW